MAPLSPPPGVPVDRDQDQSPGIDADVEARPLLSAEEEEDIRQRGGHSGNQDDDIEGKRYHGLNNGHLPGTGAKHVPRGRISALLHRFQARKPTTIIWLLSAAMFVFTASGMMVMVPMFRLMEDAICHTYYKKSPGEKIEEAKCKVDEVQSELAWLGGIATMLGSVIGMIAALPYGVLADRIGRRKVFGLAYLGIFLSFAYGPLILWFDTAPTVWVLLFGSFFLLIGGGVPIATNSLNAMAVDISPNGDTSTGLLYLSAGGMAGGLVAPVIAGLLMTISPWLPILVVFSFAPIITLIMLLVPETLDIEKIQTNKTTSGPSTGSAVMNHTREALHELKVAFTLLRDKNLVLTLINFAIHPALMAAYMGTLPQYVSKYFGWTFAQTSYTLSPAMGVLHVLIMVILPPLSRGLTSKTGRFRLSTFGKDLLLTKISVGFLMIGTLIEGLAGSIVVFIVGLGIMTLGAANGPLCRAVATSFVEQHHISRLYGLISMLETSGALIGGPVLAWCFNVGMEKGGLLRGLPWFYVVMLLGIALLALMFIREPAVKVRNKADGEEGEEDEDKEGECEFEMSNTRNARADHGHRCH
ncbi:general substrate transporter [Naviculisporaceae sp. PSN 640]